MPALIGMEPMWCVSSVAGNSSTIGRKCVWANRYAFGRRMRQPQRNHSRRRTRKFAPRARRQRERGLRVEQRRGRVTPPRTLHLGKKCLLMDQDGYGFCRDGCEMTRLSLAGVYCESLETKS